METIISVIDALERAPSIVLPLVREVPPTLVKRRPTPTKWSVHEHACHLAQVDGLYSSRLDQILAQPQPVITPYDPGRDEADDVFLRMDLERSLEQYAEGRTALVKRLRRLAPEVWSRTAEHGEYSHYSVLIMFRHVALHDLFHAYRIEELLLRREWTQEWKLFATGIVNDWGHE
jgi:DinB family protein